MPQVLLMVAPSVQDKISPLLYKKLAQLLIDDVELVFNIKGKEDVAFTVINLAYVINEADVQVEVRYTAGQDEYSQGKPFEPSKDQRKRIIEKMIKTVREVLAGIASTISIWPIPVKESEFEMTFGIPENYIDIGSAPESEKIGVFWKHSISSDGICGKAVRHSDRWYIEKDSDNLLDEDRNACATPVAWNPYNRPHFKPNFKSVVQMDQKRESSSSGPASKMLKNISVLNSDVGKIFYVCPDLCTWVIISKEDFEKINPYIVGAWVEIDEFNINTD